MHTTFRIAALGLTLALGSAHATDDTKASAGRAAQQERMKGCNAEAKSKGLKGDERRAFMGTCLKKDKAA